MRVFRHENPRPVYGVPWAIVTRALPPVRFVWFLFVFFTRHLSGSVGLRGIHCAAWCSGLAHGENERATVAWRNRRLFGAPVALVRQICVTNLWIKFCVFRYDTRRGALFWRYRLLHKKNNNAIWETER